MLHGRTKSNVKLWKKMGERLPMAPGRALLRRIGSPPGFTNPDPRGVQRLGPQLIQKQKNERVSVYQGHPVGLYSAGSVPRQASRIRTHVVSSVSGSTR